MRDYREIVKRIQGPLAPVLVAYSDDESVDVDSTCRWVDWMIRGGIRLFWTTAGTSNYICLTDDEIVEVNRAVARTIGQRGVFIASTAWQWPVARCREFIRQAAEWGVDIVKCQIEWCRQPTDDQVVAHYRAIAEDSPLPLFAYALPCADVGNDLLRRIIEIPQFVGEKNDIDDYRGHERFFRCVDRYAGGPGRFVPMTGGGLSSVLHGWDFGVRAYGDVIAWFAPGRTLEFDSHVRAGDRAAAVAFVKHWEHPLYEQWQDLGVHCWSWGHAACKLLGHFESDRMRFPLATATAEQAEGVARYLSERGVLV